MLTNQVKVNGIQRNLISNQGSINTAAVHITDQDKANQLVVPNHQLFVAVCCLGYIFLTVIAAGSNHMQTKETGCIHRECGIKYLVTACHVDACSFALQVCVGQDCQNTVGICCNVMGYGAVACGIYILDGGFTAGIDQNAAVDLTADFFCQLGIRTNTYSHNQHIKIQFQTALAYGVMGSGELCHGIGQIELHAQTFQIALEEGGTVFIQYIRQDTRCHINDGQGLGQMQNAFCTFQTDQTGTDNQYILILLVTQQTCQAMCVIQCHKGGLILNGIQTFHRRDERAGTGADGNLVIGNRFAVFQYNLLGVFINSGNRAAQHGGNPVCFIEVIRTIMHLIFRGLAQQQIGDERASIGKMRLTGNQDDFTLLIHRTDAFNRTDCGGCIADNHIFHVAHLSSNTIALFGQPATHCGVPSAFLVHSSHFCTAPDSEVLIQP